VNLPNALTLLRIALVPAFGWLWLAGHHRLALLAFALGGLTDLLDGFLARTLNQRTRIGALLDPIADKLTLLVAFLVGASDGAVPWWVAAIVIGRDIVLTIGAAVFIFLVHGKLDPVQWHPTRIGKYATVFQLATVGFALVTRAAEAPALYPWAGAIALIAAALTVLSAIQYVSTGIAALQTKGTA